MRDATSLELGTAKKNKRFVASSISRVPLFESFFLFFSKGSIFLMSTFVGMPLF